MRVTLKSFTRESDARGTMTFRFDFPIPESDVERIAELVRDGSPFDLSLDANRKLFREITGNNFGASSPPLVNVEVESDGTLDVPLQFGSLSSGILRFNLNLVDGPVMVTGGEFAYNDGDLTIKGCTFTRPRTYIVGNIVDRETALFKPFSKEAGDGFKLDLGNGAVMVEGGEFSYRDGSLTVANCHFLHPTQGLESVRAAYGSLGPPDSFSDVARLLRRDAPSSLAKAAALIVQEIDARLRKGSGHGYSDLIFPTPQP